METRKKADYRITIEDLEKKGKGRVTTLSLYNQKKSSDLTRISKCVKKFLEGNYSTKRKARFRVVIEDLDADKDKTKSVYLYDYKELKEDLVSVREMLRKKLEEVD